MRLSLVDIVSFQVRNLRELEKNIKGSLYNGENERSRGAIMAIRVGSGPWDLCSSVARMHFQETL